MCIYRRPGWLGPNDEPDNAQERQKERKQDDTDNIIEERLQCSVGGRLEVIFNMHEKKFFPEKMNEVGV